jgi:rhamnogalacturonyl hydrolase YesR
MRGLQAILLLLLAVPASAANSTAAYSKRMAASIMSRSQGLMTGTGGSSELLQAGITQKALKALAAQYGGSDAGFAAQARAYVHASAMSVAPYVANATYDALSYPMDRLSNGNALLTLATTGGGGGGNATEAAALRASADALRASIDRNRRNNESGLWYYTYPEWSYLDGMYSLAPYYTLYTLSEAANGSGAALNATALDDMLLQLDLLWAHTRNASSGLLVHGYDESRTAVWANPVTGASPHVWGRSLGWLAMALVDTLELLLPTPTPATRGHCSGSSSLAPYAAHVRRMFQSLAPALAAAADPATGAWWQVLDRPGDAGNYIESSGSAMFAYALLKGARLGYLEGVLANATVVGVRARQYLTDTFVVDNGNGTLGYNGTVSVCSLNSTASYEVNWGFICVGKGGWVAGLPLPLVLCQVNSLEYKLTYDTTQYYVGQPLNYNSVLGSGAYVLASLEAERLGH